MVTDDSPPPPRYMGPSVVPRINLFCIPANHTAYDLLGKTPRPECTRSSQIINWRPLFSPPQYPDLDVLSRIYRVQTFPQESLQYIVPRSEQAVVAGVGCRFNRYLQFTHTPTPTGKGALDVPSRIVRGVSSFSPQDNCFGFTKLGTARYATVYVLCKSGCRLIAQRS